MAQTKTQQIELWNAANTTASIAVNGATTVYSKAFKIDKGEYFGVSYKANSGGTIALKVELEVSMDGINYAEAEGLPDIASSLDDSDLHVKTLPVVRSVYLRFKITGGATNAATTTIEITVSL